MTKPKKPNKLKLFFRVLYVFFRYNFFAAAGYYNRSKYSEETLWQSYSNLNLTAQQLVYVFVGAAAYIYDLENGYYGN